MSRYELQVSTQDGEMVYVLKDREASAEASLVPAIGNHLFRFEVAGFPVILQPDDFKQLREKPSRYGYPILYPPNRIRGAAFNYAGREYRFPVNAEGDYIHGELKDHAWKVIAEGADDRQGAYVTSEFRIADDPKLLAMYRHELRFVITYRLREGKLVLEGSVTNESSAEAPFALGFHPYFPIPEGDEAVVQLQAEEQWPLSGAFVAGLGEQTAYVDKLRQGIPFSEVPSDGYQMIGLSAQGDTHRYTIRYPQSRKRLVYETDRAFPFVVVFKPAWARAISLEPYTYVTDAFNLPYPHEETGARGIAAGESIPFTLTLQLVNED